MTPAHLSQLAYTIASNPLENQVLRVKALEILQAVAVTSSNIPVSPEAFIPQFQNVQDLMGAGLADLGPGPSNEDLDDIARLTGISVPVLGGPPIPLKIPTDAPPES